MSKNRKRALVMVLAVVFTAINIWFLDLRVPLLIYTSAVNGVAMAAITAYSIDGLLRKQSLAGKLAYLGLTMGMFMAVMEINHQIYNELFIHRDNLNPMLPYIGYFRFYLVGLLLGVAKAFYYYVVPLTLIFASIGFPLDKFRRMVNHIRRSD